MQLTKRPSIRAVARTANVSPTVVSAVLNGRAGSTRYSEDVAKKVRRVASELGYIPNKLTSSIINKTPLTIGVLSSWPDHEKYSRIIRILSEEFRKMGYHLIVEVCDFEPESFLQHFRDIVSMQVGGIIILPFSSSHLDRDSVFELARECLSISSATVVVDWYWSEYIFDSVNSDDFQLVSVPLKHLIEMGHRDIVCLGAGSPCRASHVEQVLKEYGLEKKIEYCTSGLAQIYKQDYEEGRELAKMVLKMNPRPTAIMCLQDRLAVGAYSVCEKAGLKIGRDIALTGIDNTLISEHMPVPLTSLDIHIDLFASNLISMLLEKMSGQIFETPRICNIEPELIVRESSNFTPN